MPSHTKKEAGKKAYAKNHLRPWTLAAKEWLKKHGKPGKFTPLPKKGTEGYKELKKLAEEHGA